MKIAKYNQLMELWKSGQLFKAKQTINHLAQFYYDYLKAVHIAHNIAKSLQCTLISHWTQIELARMYEKTEDVYDDAFLYELSTGHSPPKSSDAMFW